MNTLCRLAACLALLLGVNALSSGAEPGVSSTPIQEGMACRERGDTLRSVELLRLARSQAGNDAERTKAGTELAMSLIQNRQYDEAERLLTAAHALHTGLERANDALRLGNLALARRQPKAARQYFSEARALSGGDLPLQVAATLNLARLQEGSDRLAALVSASQQIPKIEPAGMQVRLLVNLAHQARAAGDLELAYSSLDAARRKLMPLGGSRLLAETFDALAQMYEDQGKVSDALVLNSEGLAVAASMDTNRVADLLAQMEWRSGRLERHRGSPGMALAAFQRAAESLERIRHALPIEHDDGRSSYAAMIEPLYLGLVELLLSEADVQPPAVREQYLRKARETIEMTRQAEMQDYLGDRCSVETVRGTSQEVGLPEGTAALYTVVLPGHVELLLETPAGIEHRKVDVGSDSLRATAKALAVQMRVGAGDYQANARQLYDWLIRPVLGSLSRTRTHTLIFLPSGTLRLLPVAALHDGKQYLVEQFALVNATGLSMTALGAQKASQAKALIAGLSEPGPVVGKVTQRMLAQLLQPAVDTAAVARGLADTLPDMRAIDRDTRNIILAGQKSGQSLSQTPGAGGGQIPLRHALALPGVRAEVTAIGQTLRGKSLLNEAFTVGNFSREAETGEYRILHIASHGMFGGNAESSFILAYDDLLTLDMLQGLLNSENLRKHPIEILSLSACQTAEGNERAPLGISGAAIKARARSVLGTLWPVEDHSARELMDRFYTGIGKDGLTKSEALRRAQASLIRSAQYSHPMFWAPYVLIGNWQ